MDLNSDLGEGFGAWSMGDDAAMLSIVTSASIACGFHAGDPVVMRRSCEQAVAAGVRIGAHVSYRDLVGFGRRAMSVPPEELRADVLYQIGSLQGFAQAAGDRVRYVKPHGALYHAAAAADQTAQAVVGAMVDIGADLALLGPANSRLSAAAESAGITFVAEGFADRGYAPDGTLLPRGQAGAVLSLDQAVRQAISLARESRVGTHDGDSVPVSAGSICVHSDTPAAVAMAQRIRAVLREHGVELGAFT